MLKIGVLISGRGSNLQALIDAAQQEGFPAQIVCVISNIPDAYGLERARNANIPAVTIHHRDFKDRASFEQAVDAKLNDYGVQLICLAGFMRLLSPWLVDRWRDRLINIHPTLLPAFPGLDCHRQVLDYGAKFSGCTVHFVRSELDHGPIIAQAVVPVLPEDTEDSLAARILKAEHKIYPQVIRWIGENRVNVHGEKVFVTGCEDLEIGLFNPA